MKVRPRSIQIGLYQDECRANLDGEPDKIRYHVVTNSSLFKEDFLALIEEKKKIEGEKQKANTEQCKEAVLRALESTNDIVTRDSLTTRTDEEVELFKIPIADNRLVQYTPFEVRPSPILIFRTSPGETRERGDWSKLSASDLEHLTDKGRRVQQETNSITPLTNLYVEAIDGNELTNAREMLLPNRNESILALQSLRITLEQALRRHAEFYFLKQGRQPEHPEKRRGYLGFAKSLGIISRADALQAEFVMDLANSAIHGEYLDIQGLTAKIALHWVSEFVGKTIGYHWLSKFRAHGTIFSPEFFFTIDQDEHRLRRAIHDQLQAATEYRLKGLRAKDFVYVEKLAGKIDRYTKEEVMGCCKAVSEKLEQLVTTFTRPERKFLDLIRIFTHATEEDPVSKEQVPIYTAQDAIRTCMFLYGIVRNSREIEVANLENNTTEYDRLDNQMTLAIRRRGTGNRRADKYDFKNTLAGLEQELYFISEIARGTPYDVLTPIEMGEIPDGMLEERAIRALFKPEKKK